MEYAHKPENLAQLEKETRELGFPETMVSKLRDRVLHDQSYAFFVIAPLEFAGRKLFASLYYERAALFSPYAFKNFNLSFTGQNRPLIHENQFVLGNGYDVSLREAVNLMEGRFIYREPSFDSDKGVYWVRLGDSIQWPGQRNLDYRKVDFRADEAIVKSGLGKWLDEAGIKGLTVALNVGDRKEANISPMGQTRTIWVETDPVNRRLLLTNSKRQQVGLPAEANPVRMQQRIIKRSRGISR